MKIKRIKKIRVNSYIFSIIWDSKKDGGYCDYSKKTITIGTSTDEGETFDTLCHELLEMVAIENHVRMRRPDCNGDYIFVYDHRQHDVMANMFAGLLSQFID